MVRFKDRHHQKTVFTSKVATNWISQIGQQVLGFLQNTQDEWIFGCAKCWKSPNQSRYQPKLLNLFSWIHWFARDFFSNESLLQNFDVGPTKHRYSSETHGATWSSGKRKVLHRSLAPAVSWVPAHPKESHGYNHQKNILPTIAS